MVCSFSQTAGLSSGRMSGVYCLLFVCTFLKYSHASETSSGRIIRSSTVIAWTFAPAVTPLCAIGVAIAMAFAQLWPGAGLEVRGVTAA